MNNYQCVCFLYFLSKYKAKLLKINDRLKKWCKKYVIYITIIHN